VIKPVSRPALFRRRRPPKRSSFEESHQENFFAVQKTNSQQHPLLPTALSASSYTAIRPIIRHRSLIQISATHLSLSHPSNHHPLIPNHFDSHPQAKESRSVICRSSLPLFSLCANFFSADPGPLCQAITEFIPLSPCKDFFAALLVPPFTLPRRPFFNS